MKLRPAEEVAVDILDSDWADTDGRKRRICLDRAEVLRWAADALPGPGSGADDDAHDFCDRTRDWLIEEADAIEKGQQP